MRVSLTIAAAAAAALTFANSSERSLHADIRHHLAVAKGFAATGHGERAVAHASVVVPTRVLRVRVDFSNLPASSQGLYRNALAGAFRMWEIALGQKQFESVETGPADVVVHFQRAVTHKGQDICGHTRWTRGLAGSDVNRPVVAADVQIRMEMPDSQPLTFEQLRACAAHELGHVLGLDESPTGRGIMGPMNAKNPVLSIRPEDVAALLGARREAQQIQREFRSLMGKQP